MRAGTLVALLIAGAGVALVRQSKSEADADSKALQADLAELPEPLRVEVTKALFTSQPADVPQLQQLAAALDVVGYKKAAARVRARVEQLQQMKGGAP